MTLEKHHPEQAEGAAMSSRERMTSRERQELMALVRRREKLAKAQADVRAAELMATSSTRWLRSTRGATTPCGPRR